MPQRSTKWGILSTSAIATGKVIPALQRCTNAEVIAIASRDVEKAQRGAKSLNIRNAYDSYDALLADRNVEAVYIPLPNSLHHEWTIRAARAGKHVLCEKPAALEPSAAEEMIAACKANNVRFMEGFMYRFHPQFSCVKQWLAEERIGTLRLIRTSFSFLFEARHSKIRVQASMGGGALADLGVYGIDLVHWLTHAEPTRVSASGSRGLGADVETNFTAELAYASGLRAILDGGFDRARQNICELTGESGTITIESPFYSTDGAAVRLRSATGDAEQAFPLADLFQLEFEHFSALVEGSSVPAISAEDTVANARVLAALRSSIDLRQPVDLP